MANIIRGRGYVYQGAWLGTDPAAFNEIELRSDDVSIVERQDTFTRYITRQGREVIMFDPKEVAEGPFAVIDATPSVKALPNLKSRKSLPSPKKGK